MEALLQRLSALRLMRPPTDCELSPPLIAALYWISQHPGCGVQDLAEGLKVTPPTVSVGVRRLVKDGWLERRRDPNDKRAKPLYITEKSETLLAQLRMHQRAALKEFLSGLMPEEQDTFLLLFDKAVSKVEDTMRES
ncbi:MAG: MarR family transcriptional regulator [Anaerolineales bacterium]|nr:MarR family transcriptional regulator [Chloroflexota bacterium]MBL6981386.1 MarR family transcriptional regulator [Anaerolineales bacterium]